VINKDKIHKDVDTLDFEIDDRSRIRKEGSI
jgi:hypothetical protein